MIATNFTYKENNTYIVCSTPESESTQNILKTSISYPNTKIHNIHTQIMIYIFYKS